MLEKMAAARFWLACAVLYAGLLLLYAPSLSFRPLSLDDLGQLQAAAQQSFAQIFTPDRYGHVRPVKSALFWLLARSSEPWGAFRASMLAALLVATVLVQRLATRLTRSRVLGLMVAACWALNPTTATVTCWLSATNIALCLIGMLGYLECASRALDPVRAGSSLRARARLVRAMVSLGFALASHELAVTAPLLLWVHQSWLVPSERARSMRSVYLGSACAVLLFAACALAVGRSPTEYRFGAEPAWLISFSAARYLGQNALFWLLPGDRFGVLLSDRPAQHLLMSGALWVGLIGCAVVLWKQRRRDPVLGFGLVWFFVTLAPVANFVPFGNTPLAMHYAYLPGVGLSLALVRGLNALAGRIARGRDVAARALMFALLAGLSAYWLPQSARAIRAWGDEELLFALSVANHPGEIEPLVNLGSVYLNRQRYDRAAVILERARALAPDDLGVVRNRFALFWQTGQIEAALAVLDAHPQLAAHPELELGRGQALARLGRWPEAAVALQRAFDSDSPVIDRELRFAAGYQLLGALLQSERRGEAQRILDRLRAAYPERDELLVADQLLRGP
ncbi:MAG TPA: tetratricopeptide repeat protein [Polyangiales bacterium]|nr:tetratricopeptide repeat protein [Polyangiales bacterium]